MSFFSSKPSTPEFHLVAQLSRSDGAIECLSRDEWQVLLPKSDERDIVILSTVEDSFPRKRRMIDHVLTLFADKKGWFSWMSSQPQQEPFPRPGSPEVPEHLKGLNGILMKATPYKMGSDGQDRLQEPKHQVVYLMTIWIGNPAELDTARFAKLSDFLYCVSSVVIDATFFPDYQMKKDFWSRSICNKYQGNTKVCFILFNAPLPNDQGQLSGMIANSEFEEWTTLNGDCFKFSNNFNSIDFYRFFGPESGVAPNLLKNFKIDRAWLCPTLKLHGNFDVFDDIVSDLNNHYPVAHSRQSSSGPPAHLQDTIRTQKISQPKRADVIAKAVKTYIAEFGQRFAKNPTADPVKVREINSSVLEKLKLKGNDIKIALESEFKQITRALAQLELEFLVWESNFAFLLLTPDATHQDLNDFLNAGPTKQSLLSKLKLNELPCQSQILDPFISAYGHAILERMKSIVNTFTADTFEQVVFTGYLKDEVIATNHHQAKAKLLEGPKLEGIANFALDNMFDLIKIQNGCWKQKMEIFASQAHEIAMAEYQRSIDHILQRAVYPKQLLMETHRKVTAAILGSFDQFQNKIWQLMVMKLKAEMEAQLPEALQKNYVNAMAAHTRYKAVLAFAFDAYQSNLGPDYDKLVGRKKQRAHDDARRAALGAYREKVSGEPQAWVSQWYHDLYGRIGQESPDLHQPTFAASSSESPTALLKYDFAGNVTEETTTLITGQVNANVNNMDSPITPDPTEIKLREQLKRCMSEMEAKLTSDAEIQRPVKVSVRKALDSAEKVLGRSVLSEQRLKQTLETLNVWRESMLMDVIDIEEDK